MAAPCCASSQSGTERQIREVLIHIEVSLTHLSLLAIIALARQAAKSGDNGERAF